MTGKQWPPPGCSVVQGDYDMNPRWSIHLPEPFAQRVEDGCLVLWRPGLTIWVSAWNNDQSRSRRERLSWIREHASVERFAECETETDDVTRFSYRFHDTNDDGPVRAVYSYGISDDGHLQIAVYFDDPRDDTRARELADSVTKRTKVP